MGPIYRSGKLIRSDNTLNRNLLFPPNKVAVRSAREEITQPSLLLRSLNVCVDTFTGGAQELTVIAPSLLIFSLSKHQSVPMGLANTQINCLL